MAQNESSDLELVARVLQFQEEEKPEDGIPWMPHLCLTRQQLDSKLPSIQAPSDDGLVDPDHDREDSLLQHGQRIADKIAEGMLKHGRTRRDNATLV